jgi:hypothetical protein
MKKRSTSGVAEGLLYKPLKPLKIVRYLEVAWGSLGNAELGQRHGIGKPRHQGVRCERFVLLCIEIVCMTQSPAARLPRNFA